MACCLCASQWAILVALATFAKASSTAFVAFEQAPFFFSFFCRLPHTSNNSLYGTLLSKPHGYLLFNYTNASSHLASFYILDSILHLVFCLAL
jgi:hypothetical protein